MGYTKTAWVWNKGSIDINSNIYDNVCDNLSMKVIRGAVARGGHNRTAHKVVPGLRKVELTFDMDLPSSALRILRRGTTSVTVILTFINQAKLSSNM